MSFAANKPPCPICRKVLKKPFLKCASGHKVCQACVPSTSNICPTCGAWITKSPNLPIQIVAASANDTSKIKCKFSTRGCKYLLGPLEAKPHHLECRFRDFSCEGSKFKCWTCPWTGRYDQIQEHFNEDHEDSTLMLFKTEAMLKLDLSEDYRNISLIDYRDGQNFFWYKCKVDRTRKKFYSAVQLIGTKQLAERYCYEFEIFQGPVKKIKVTEICDSDATNVEKIFENEKCVAISFKTLENYLDHEGMMHFRFRIMSIKKNPSDSA